MFTVHLTVYLIFKTQSNEEKVLYCVLQLSSVTLLRHVPLEQLVVYLWGM